MKAGVGRTVDRTVRFFAIAAGLLTVASLLGRHVWFLELLTHFRLQFVAGATTLAVIAVVRHCKRSALIAALVAILHLLPLWPYFYPGARDVVADAEASRLMSVNVNLKNRNFDAAIALVEAEQPDVVGFLEVNEGWVRRLSVLHDAYPHSILRPENGAYGLALFSRVPLRELETSPYIEGGLQTAILAEADVLGTRTTLVLAHLAAPTSRKKAALRNRQIAEVATMLGAGTPEEKILIGDLNVTPWSPYYAQLEEDAGLRNAAAGRGYWPTWPTGFRLMSIPIDQCLLSEGFRVQGFRTGADIGSDHLPIVVDIEAGT